MIKIKAIFASKLYRASSRKERIQAALLAPGNSPLVQQLADSLDEEYKTPSNLGAEEEKKSEEAAEVDEDFMTDEEVNPETDLVKVDDIGESMKHSSPKPSGSHSHSPVPKGGDEPKRDSEDKPKADTSDLMPDSPATEDKKPEKKEEPAEASTKVTATTEVRVDPVPGEAIDPNVLKATLNSREDTAGVSRIAEKENEIWIYYKDEVNLNTIMTDVIEFLMNTSEYKYFTFNRLARSDNAIVFVVGLESYQYPEKSVEPLEATE